MKKQIFIIVILVLATFANVNKSYGQAAAGSAPRGISCVDDAMHPMAGKKYVYTAVSNQAGDYTFWSTKDMNFISTTLGLTSTNIATMLKSTTTTPAGSDLLTTSGNYAIASATDNVEITWSDAVLSGTTTVAPTFVAVNQVGPCTNNFNVWSILPIKAFTVDIRNMNYSTKNSLAYGAAESQCFDQVRGAKYNAATSAMEYNFGTQVLYFEVIAANFTNSWIPTFNLSTMGNGQTAVIEWAYNKAFTIPVTPVVCVSGTASPTAVATNLTSTTGGASIYVRVTITNNTFAGLVATDVTLSVDGVNSVGQWDIENNTLVAAGPLCNVGALNDKMDAAKQALNPRPTVTPAVTVPVTTFVAGNQTN